MAIENPALLAVLALLAAAVIVLGLALLRRAPRTAPGPDPAVAYLQQEIGRLAGQVAQIGAQIPRDVGASLQQITGQMSQRLSENAQSLQKASADPNYGSDFQQKFQANVVSQQTDDKQIVAQVQLGESDAAVVYATDINHDRGHAARFPLHLGGENSDGADGRPR